jgi:cytochrome c oxidase subunit I+III
MLLTVKWVTVALACAALAIAFVFVWTWSNDPTPLGNVDIGRDTTVPAHASGSISHAWWAVVILMLVAGSLYLSFVFSYLYVWTVAPQTWPGNTSLPGMVWPLAAAALIALAVAATYVGSVLALRTHLMSTIALLVSVVSLGASLYADIAGHWSTGLRPQVSAYAALVYLATALQLQIVAAIVVLSVFVLARSVTARAVPRVTSECLALLVYYAAGQGLLGLLLVHGFPRAVA